MNRIIRWLTRLAGTQANVLWWSGALAITLIAVEVITGIYLFVLYKVDPLHTYESLQQINNFWLHRTMRALHRYASDLLLVLAIAHGIHMIFHRRVRRWLAWIAGMLSVVAVLIVGVTGFLLVWDANGKAMAIWMGKMVSAIPLFSSAFLNSLIEEDMRLLSGFFRLNVFVHLFFTGVVAVLVWLHLTHLPRARWLTPWRTGLLVLGVLLLISVVFPAPLGPPAQSLIVPEQVTVSLPYAVFVFPVHYVKPVVWLVVLMVSACVLVAVPIYKARRRLGPSPVVDRDSCKGCSQCVEDCPYLAVHLVGKPYNGYAIVDPSICVRCGICVGACKFEGMKWQPLDEALRQVPPTTSGTLLIYCESNNIKVQGYEKIAVPCIGSVPPQWLAEVAEKFEKVLVVACSGCAFREGNTLEELRLRRKRRPPLPFTEYNGRIIYAEDAYLQQALTAQPLPGRTSQIFTSSEKPLNLPGALILFAFLTLCIAGASRLPLPAYSPQYGWAVLSVRYVSTAQYRYITGGKLSHMQIAGDSLIREITARSPLHLTAIGQRGDTIFHKVLYPRGTRADLPIEAYLELQSNQNITLIAQELWNPSKVHTITLPLTNYCQAHLRLTHHGFTLVRQVCAPRS